MLYAGTRAVEFDPTNEFVDSLPLACCLFDDSLQIIHLSGKAEALFEVDAADVTGKTPDLWQAISIADKKLFARQLADVVSGRQQQIIHQYTHRLPSRTVILCEWSLAPYRPAGSEKVCVVALIRQLNSSRQGERDPGKSDWSLLSLMGFSSLKSELYKTSRELEQLNHILQEKDQRLTTLLQNMPVGVCVLDADGSFTGEMNPAYSNMLGYAEAELHTLSLDDIIHPDDLQHSRTTVRDVIAGKLSQATHEQRSLRKGGGVVWVKVTLSPLRAVDGSITSVIMVAEDITLQKQTELALLQHAELIRMGGKIARQGCWMREPGTVAATFWSDELYDIYEYDGLSPPSIDKVFSLVLPQYRTLAWSLFDELTVKGVRTEYECEILTFKGNHKWLRVVGEPQRDADGVIIKTIGVVQDITEQKAQQKEHERIKDRISSTLDSMTESFMIIGRNWELIYLNRAASDLMKMTLDTHPRGTIWEHKPWLIDTSIYHGYHKAMEENTPFQAEYYSERLKDWLEVFAYPCDEGLAVYFHSISDRKRLEQQIRESEQKLKYVAKATLDVVWERNLVDDTIEWDDGLRKLGYPLAPDGGKSITPGAFWLQRIHPQEKQSVLNSLDAALKSSKDHWEATYRFLTADGDFIHVMDRGVVIRNSDAQPLRMIGGMADISERIKFEEHLQQSQRIESIGKLTGGLAHDFNNLLTVILGNAELLGTEAAHDRRLQIFTDAIIGSAIRGTDLTRRLLAFARRQSLEPAPVNLNRLLLAMEGLLSRSLGANIDVRIMPGNDLHMALVDSNQLEGAILNLCINSRDAMPAGGRIILETMNVTLTESSGKFLEDVVPGDYVALRVSDTGSGIPQELLGHVFEPFFTTKERGKGTGLGLSTVYGFIRQSNGYVSIESTVDAGTQVTLYLPITLQRELPPEVQLEPPVVKPVYARGEETILIVEDDIAVSSFAKQFLGSLGYCVLLAENGQCALEILDSTPGIDLLFTDIIMPGGMDGAELAREALSRYPNLRVLYTSGYTDNALLQQAGFDPEINFLPKPYTLTRMADRIRGILGQPARRALP